ncbi:hypothetical protein QBC42DRAFT_330250 [Cladorrhinum samala]|uniref:Uncharacterized protein n=1 Tax=Cladorrhinum samala TaxID=585594 RepID=A0AAV9HKV6_9PEZI|nr:hypothetical protein QBC42DRAFT_330250 [Cladorrhinum samala]
MRQVKIFAILFVAGAAGALAEAEGDRWGEQKPLGRLTRTTQQWPLAASSSVREGHSHRHGQSMSCEETYGEDWTVCGDVISSRFCYNPFMEQSCCAVDNGYCEEGTWCAPVAGYCCLDSEDLETCARNAGFDIPQDLLKPGPKHSWRAPIAAFDPDASETGSERPDDKMSALPAVIGRIYIQESVAGTRERWTLAWMGLGIGAVGLFMISC